MNRRSLLLGLPLALAAGGLLLALTINPWSLLTKEHCEKSDFVRMTCLVTSIAGGLLAAGGGLFGTASFLSTSPSGTGGCEPPPAPPHA